MQGVRVYSVHCLTTWGGSDFERTRDFWSELAERTAGRYLALENFTTVVDFMLAICYREKGPEALQVKNNGLYFSGTPGSGISFVNCKDVKC